MHHPLAPLTRLLLLPLWPVYRLLVAGRTALYRVGIRKTQRASVPVVAVGNLTVGGGGKTPFTDYLARVAARAGLSPAVITRGYGRQGRSDLLLVGTPAGAAPVPELVGDEACWLALRNPAIPVFVGAERVAAARWATVVARPGVLVLDDAFQHLRLARDLNVLLIDAEGGLGNGCVLPWGILREPVSAIGRADVIVITKAALGNPAPLAEWLRARVSVPVFLCDYRPVALRQLEGGGERPPASLRGRPVALVCGIARPASLAATLAGLGAQVGQTLSFGDHHPYGAATLARLAPLLAGAGEEPFWITTAKDAVKLRGRVAHGEKLWVLEMEVAPEPAAEAFFFDFFTALPLT